MRRFLTPSAVAAAGLALLLSGCSGESPTAPIPGATPTPAPGQAMTPTPGACSAAISLPAGPITANNDTAVIVRARVTRNGVPVPDGTSVAFTTDFGFFLENGFPTISKTTTDGAADVTAAPLGSGAANVRATYDCATASVRIQYVDVPGSGPFISTVEPSTGSAAGGETVVLNGGRFGNDATNTNVSFGGSPASVQSVANTQIVVKTPSRTLANPQVPETVDVVVSFGKGTGTNSITKPKAFTYIAIDPSKRVFVSSVSPNAGSPNGGEAVNVFGGNFGISVATTRVTFCGLPATISQQREDLIVVSTPKKTLANPAVSEACDVAVTTDLGLVSQQSAVLPQAFTYRGSGGGGGGGGGCGTDASFFLSSVSPNTGSPDGGTIVNLVGGGFPSSAANLRVDFGGLASQIASVSPTQISVSTPRRTLANPDVPETVDVTVTDLGSPDQRCAKLVGAFTYTRVALDPVIYSVSPRIGPNDAQTRVSIFGTGFQFPLQVFMTGGNCGTQRIEGTITDPIVLTQVVFKTPPGTGAYSCLSNSTADVEVLNPSTGKKASCPACFRYYGCPLTTGVAPSLIPQDQTTLVTVSGANFEEPVEATYQPGTGGAVRVNVTSVSSNSVIVQMPPLNQILQSGGGLTTCSNVIGTLTLRSTTLTCDPVTAILTYRVDPPSIRSASPTSLNQDGSAFGTAVGSGAAVITVLGTNFVDPMTVEITKGGVAIATVNNATVSSSGQLTFPAPAVPDAQMNRQDCLAGGTISGSKLVPTSFGIRVRSQRTACSSDLPAILVYNPINPNCAAGLTVTTPTLPQATLCTAYSATVAAGGGTPPYVFSQSGLPAGFTLNASTGAITATAPQLPTTGAGGPQTVSVTIGVQDAVGASTSRTYPLVINDPNGPFSVLGSALGSLPAGVTPGTVGPYTTSPATTPAGFSPVSWTVLSINPTPGGFTLNDPTSPASSIFMTPQTGNTSSISFPGGVTGGTTYTVVIRAFDAPSCGGPTHQSDFTITVTKP